MPHNFMRSDHATAHPGRLNRDSLTDAAPFGPASYPAEELIAEMGAAYLCAEAGISPAVVENQAAYISGWLENLRKDKRPVVVSAETQRAADYVFHAGCNDQA
jgi:antirestriction protein ArdC